MPASNLNLSCLQTTVRNMRSTRHSYGFLGPRGMRLGPGEQVMIPGDIWDSASKNARNFASLSRSLQSGELVVVRSPTPIYFDISLDRARTLQIANGTLSAIDPCWGTFASLPGS